MSVSERATQPLRIAMNLIAMFVGLSSTSAVFLAYADAAPPPDITLTSRTSRAHRNRSTPGSSNSRGPGPMDGKDASHKSARPSRDPSLVDLTTLQPWNHNWDGRHHLKPRGRKTRYIVLVRHGQYHSEERDDARRTLTEVGHLQADCLAERLSQYHWSPSQITYSNLTRARETAYHIQSYSKFMNVQSVVDSKLREGRPHQPVPPAGSGIYSKSEVQRDGSRIDAAFDSYFYRPGPELQKNSYDVIVCHANVIRYFVCRALQLPKEAWIRMAVPHCSITILAIRPTGYVSLKCLGDSGFMPVDLVTTS